MATHIELGYPPIEMGHPSGPVHAADSCSVPGQLGSEPNPRVQACRVRRCTWSAWGSRQGVMACTLGPDAVSSSCMGDEPVCGAALEAASAPKRRLPDFLPEAHSNPGPVADTEEEAAQLPAWSASPFGWTHDSALSPALGNASALAAAVCGRGQAAGQPTTAQQAGTAGQQQPAAAQAEVQKRAAGRPFVELRTGCVSASAAGALPPPGACSCTATGAKTGRRVCTSTAARQRASVASTYRCRKACTPSLRVLTGCLMPQLGSSGVSSIMVLPAGVASHWQRPPEAGGGAR